MYNLRCSKVLVTGGSDGIGFAIAKRLIADGAKVVITGRSEGKLLSAKERINSDNLKILMWDITNLDELESKFNEAVALLGGGVDGVVNNAGSYLTKKGYEPIDIDIEDFDYLTNINVKAPFFLMRKAIDYMSENSICGNILNISSIAARLPVREMYGGSKLILEKMTQYYGFQFAKRGIIINAIAPGRVFTSLTTQNSKYAIGKTIEDSIDNNALQRFVKPEEIAELAAYLMSDYGEIIVGTVVKADGGTEASY